MSKRAVIIKVFTIACVLWGALFSVFHHGTRVSGAARADVRVRVGKPVWVVPSPKLPKMLELAPANNNLSIAVHEGRLFLAWRNAPFHFASPEAKIYVVSSRDMGKTWDFEHVIHTGSDLREPYLVSFARSLILTCFEGGTNPLAFEPRRMLRTVRISFQNWTPVQTWGDEGEVPWAYQIHGGRLYLTTYHGNHYALEPGNVELRFYFSEDGIHFQPVGGENAVVYRGGVSEAGFAFDAEGNLWGVTRNEDGDGTGFGSHVVFAPANNLSAWEFPAKSCPYKYDSPRMFAHGDEVYLIARRDPCAPFDLGNTCLPFSLQKIINLVSYSLRPKRTALYRIDKRERKVVWVCDLPGASDTAFPSIIKTGPSRFLVANYTSPLCYRNVPWIFGQISPAGTSIYFVELNFDR